MLTRIRFSWNRRTSSVRCASCFFVSQPWLLVSWSGLSGTSVTWLGHTSNTMAVNSSVGLPSMFSSVFTSERSAYTSLRRMCRSSGRGCIVMPSAPNRSQSVANCSTSGRLPPRALRRVATLFIFTLSRVIVCRGFMVFACALHLYRFFTLQRYSFFFEYANNSFVVLFRRGAVPFPQRALMVSARRFQPARVAFRVACRAYVSPVQQQPVVCFWDNRRRDVAH